MLSGLIKVVKANKLASGLGIILLIGAGYFGFKYFNKDLSETRYALAAVERGAIIASISGSGQIAVTNQVEIKSRASGDLVEVKAKNGQDVNAGDIIAIVNSRDAYKTVRDAEVNLQNARLALDKLRRPATSYNILQAENFLTAARTSLAKLRLSQQTAYERARESKQRAEDNISKSYEDAFNAFSNAFLNLPSIITELNDILYSREIGASEPTLGNQRENHGALMDSVELDDRDSMRIFLTGAENDYRTARSKYEANFGLYKTVTRYSSRATIESLLTETLETTKSVAQAAKSESNFLDAWVDYRVRSSKSVFAKVREYQANLGTYIGQTNNHVSNLLSIQRTMQDNRETLINSERDIAAMDRNNPLDIQAAEAAAREREASLQNLRAGADPLDLQSQELAVRQRQNAFADAREKLADYAIRAPFTGAIAKIDVKKGDPISTGGIIAILITKQRLAEISLNEVDAAKVRADQKATLIFDAIEGLNITGEVAEVDTLGVVAQGVVTYNVKILFDTQDERVKPGMSVSATIVTDIKQNVLIIPNAAIKSAGDSTQVEMPNEDVNSGSAGFGNEGVALNNSPRREQVQVGLANDTMTEIISGLNEGDMVIVRTITPSTGQNQSAQGQSLFQIPGGRGAGGMQGGSMRIRN
ncbi:MAG: Efflux transporter, RND family, MFP subunit [Candidatus Magasanikbacteria bacterium GW2011_GWA2_46_17]|uniref:Efflux transporter, RND family, MFP subunit n=1 Tax=Candidatus Magasanikbacteria bacterium GW2011_GWA2_46_17 TaxID=1619042 RepID=A0A0G1R6K5_9BACT|nr:MAG: Efflux transporter, RND family, MFP subunit [Candidatus Magasanikbacteria bacterium GW2011_GWA2_46_17]